MLKKYIVQRNITLSGRWLDVPDVPSSAPPVGTIPYGNTVLVA